MFDKNIKNIIFDFDGVILDSVPVKTEAFRKLFADYPIEKVEKLIEFHLENGGVSRYEKIKYFFNILLNKNINDDLILEYAKRYSNLTKEELASQKYLIEDSLNFIKQNYQKYNMHIASGSDENDLKYICEKLALSQYFLSINGSPAKKSEIIKHILDKFHYQKEKTVMIGDSITDYNAAKENKIVFYGYNNTSFMLYINNYIKLFKY